MTISSEAVEAAVKAWDHHWGDRYGDEAVEEMGEEVRVALEAAAPFIRAGALEDAAVELLSDESAPPKSFKEMYNAIYATWLTERAKAVRTP